MKRPIFLMDKIQQKQKMLMWGIAGIVAGLVVVVVVVFASEPSKRAEVKTSYKSNITTGTDRLDPKEAWMEQIRAENQLQRDRIDTLEKALEKVLTINAARQEKTAEKAEQNSVTEIRKDVQAAESFENGPQSPFLPVAPTNEMGMMEAGHPHPSGTTSVMQATPKFRSKGIHKISINLANSRAHKSLKTVDNYIPAGSFAAAKVLTGVDASTSIQSQNDPRPITLQIMDEAVLPGNYRANLKGCHVTAAAAGDISAERVFIRLENLSCVERKTGEVIEIKVKGFLAGSDSKAGQRGRLVDRTGPMMRNAAIGGFLSSMGNFLSQNQNPITFFPSGLAETNKVPTGQFVGQSAMKGVGGALEKYADFYIKRAEQMQPIVEVTAGQDVAVVFTEGFSLSDSVTRNAIAKANDSHRLQQIQSLERGEKPVSAWLPKQEP